MKRLTNKTAALGIPMLGAIAGLAFLALFLGGGWAPTAQADPGTTIGIDADPSQSPANQPTQLGSIEECFSMDSGQQRDVDLFVTDVLELLSFSAYILYDEAVVNVVAVDVEQFLAAGAGSSVFDASHPVFDGLYYVGASDIGTDNDSGSGVLARLTLQGVGAGISPIWLSEYPEDIVLRPNSGPDIIPDARYHGRMGVDQVDSDADTLADMCDPDVDSDGDTVFNPADADDDDDNYSDQTEAFLGTDPLDDCPNVGGHDAWPPDNNADGWCNVLDVLTFKPHIISQFMDPEYDRRFDMNADQNINIMDVLLLKPTINTQCSNP
jgi:hypothetical protein